MSEPGLLLGVCRSPTTSIPHTFSPGDPLSSRVTRFLTWSLMHLTSSFLSQVTAWTIPASMLYKADRWLCCVDNYTYLSSNPT